MPTPASEPTSPLRAVCETAARALQCPVHLAVGAEGWRADPDPETGACPVHPAPECVPEPAELAVPFRAGEMAGRLSFQAAPGRVWSAAERATADSLARLAAEVAAELARQRAYFEEILDRLETGLVVVDPELRFEYCSPTSIRDPELRRWAVGRTVEEYGRRCGLPDEVVRERVASLALARDERRTREFEEPVRGADGTTRQMLRRALPLLDEHGRVARIIGYSIDITDRKHAEWALQESEQRWRAMIENAQDITTVSDADGRMGYQSPSLSRVLGYTAEEVQGRSAYELIHPDDVERVAAEFARAVAEPGRVVRSEYRLRHRDGSWRHMEAFGRTVLPDTAGAGLVANVRDVTQRVEAERVLKRSEEHFRRLIENGNDLLMISAPDGALTYVSPSVERLLGYRPEEMMGMTPGDLVHPDDVAALTEGIGKIVARPGKVEWINWRIRHRDGSWRLFEAIGKTLDPRSARDGVVVNGRDITDRQAAEAALRQAKAEAEHAREEAERANVAKSEFLSRMSHELRTPLNSILGFAQVLEDVEMAPEYRTGVRHIVNAGRHLLNLINEVLDIARIEADQQPMSLEPVLAGTVVREALDMVRPLAAARGVWLTELPGPGAARYVRADRQRLVQVLLNLLSNAVKYNRPGGGVRVGYDTVPAAGGGERLRVRVADEGGGIAPERRDQLFVPFARLGAEHSGVEGTGLGLALSQRLARAMGGDLALEGSGPEGSTFSVELECTADPLARAPALSATSERRGGAVHREATLLYVEDNLANLALVETILLPRPEWHVVPALQGRLGLELARQHAPDVVLLDLHLPDISGREVLRHLRADPRTAATPVVVISADATPRTVEALREEGADAFLTKPLDVREFLSTLERLLARRP